MGVIDFHSHILPGIDDGKEECRDIYRHASDVQRARRGYYDSDAALLC